MYSTEFIPGCVTVQACAQVFGFQREDDDPGFARQPAPFGNLAVERGAADHAAARNRHARRLLFVEGLDAGGLGGGGGDRLDRLTAQFFVDDDAEIDHRVLARGGRDQQQPAARVRLGAPGFRQIDQKGVFAGFRKAEFGGLRGQGGGEGGDQTKQQTETAHA